MPTSSTAMLKMLQHIGRDHLTVHGFRSTNSGQPADQAAGGGIGRKMPKPPPPPVRANLFITPW